MSPIERPQAIIRRDFLKRAGLLAAALPAGGALLAACGGSDDPSDGGKLDRPLRLHHDAALGPAFSPYIKEFNKLYAPLRLATSYVPQDYIGTTQTQLAGGSVDYDVLFSDPGYLEKWYSAGWIRSLDDLPGVAEVVGAMRPDYAELLYAADGNLVALPYYVGTDIFIYNSGHLGKIGADVPTSWDEVLEQARELKAKGVSATPYSPWWIKDFALIYYAFLDVAISDGAAPFFDDDGAPQFQDDPVAIRTLERWKTFYDEGLVPQDIFTTDYGSITNIIGGGKSTFTHQVAAELIGLSDPKNSKVADVIANAMMPGSTKRTLSYMATWYMTSSTPSPPDAWKLMQYLAAKDIEDRFYVPENLVAIDLGSGTPYDDVNSAPKVAKSWEAWSDVDLLTKQMDQSQTMGTVVNREWFPAYLEMVSGLLQEAILGRKSARDALAEAATFVDSKR